MNWFDVDKDGLAKLLEKRGKSFALYELLQNALDTDATRVDITIEPVPRSPFAIVRVEDNDPTGFSDLSHAFTLFAESNRKADASKRGRFNLGEKLVLAICKEAEIRTTTGVVHFDEKDGRRWSNQRCSRRERGTLFEATLRLTRDEMNQAIEDLRKVIVPPNVEVTVNGQPVAHRTPVAAFEASLQTEFADYDGVLRRSERKTTVSVYEVAENEVAHIYEMGIPVVETGDRYHVDVAQKVPANMDRDNVPPAYLRTLRTHVLNATNHLIGLEDAKAPWVRDALEHGAVTGDAVNTVLDLRFGAQRVISDPSDPEGTKIAVSKGFTVIPGGALSAKAWENVKKHDAARPAGQVTPSPKPYSENGKEQKVLPREQWTVAMTARCAWIEQLAVRLLNKPIEIRLVADIDWPFAATYGAGCLTINYGRLSKGWFDEPKRTPRVLGLLLHEFSHEKVSDHLSAEFAEEVGRLGVKCVDIAVTKPEFFAL